MEPAKMASPKSAPKDAQVMAQILKDMGITEYEPRVINQMLEFAYRYVTTILEDAKVYSSHAKKPSVDAEDVRLAIQCRTDQSFTSPPPRDFLLDIARQKNQTPLPLIKPYSGPRLPPDRYCLTAPNYRLKSLQKKVSSSAGRITVPRLSVGAVSSRPSTPTLGTPSAQTVSVSTKVGTPVSLTGQRFTVQIPSSQTTVKAGKVPAVKQTLPSGKWLLFVLVLAEYLREGKLGFSVGKSFFKLFIFFFFLHSHTNYTDSSECPN
uniref:TATA-box binding protein associated factor 9 n=1 Tax=Anas platyrhynchos TaxID=8839 RepID=A0A8B9TQF8_ANAPL